MRVQVIIVAAALLTFAPHAHSKALNAPQQNNEIVEYMPGVDVSADELENLQGEGAARIIIKGGEIVVSGVSKFYKGMKTYCKNNYYCASEVTAAYTIYSDAKKALCSKTGVGC